MSSSRRQDGERRRESLDGMPEVDFGAFLGRNSRPSQAYQPKSNEPSTFTPPESKPVMKNGKPAPVTGRMRQGAPRLGGLGLGGISSGEPTPKKSKSSASSSSKSKGTDYKKASSAKPATDKGSVERPFLSPEMTKPSARSGAFALDRPLPEVVKNVEPTQDVTEPSPDLSTDSPDMSAPWKGDVSKDADQNMFGGFQQAIMGQGSSKENEQELLSAYGDEDPEGEAEDEADTSSIYEDFGDDEPRASMDEDVTARQPNLKAAQLDKSLPASPKPPTDEKAATIRDVEPVNDDAEEASQQPTTIDTPEPSPTLGSTPVSELMTKRASASNHLAPNDDQRDMQRDANDRLGVASSMRRTLSGKGPPPPRPTRRPVSPKHPASPEKSDSPKLPTESSERFAPPSSQSKTAHEKRDISSTRSHSSTSSVSTDLSSVDSQSLFFQQETPRASVSSQGGLVPGTSDSTSSAPVAPSLVRSQSRGNFVGLRLPSSLLGGGAAAVSASPAADLIAPQAVSSATTRESDSAEALRDEQDDNDGDDTPVDERPQSRFESRRQGLAANSRPASVKSTRSERKVSGGPESAYPTPSPEPESRPPQTKVTDAEAPVESPETSSPEANSPLDSPSPSPSPAATPDLKVSAPEAAEPSTARQEVGDARAATPANAEDAEGAGIGVAMAGAVVAGGMAVGSLTWKGLSAVASTGWSLGRAIAPRRVERNEDEDSAAPNMPRSDSANTVTKVKAKVGGVEKTAVVPGQFTPVVDTDDDSDGETTFGDARSGVDESEEPKEVVLNAEDVFKDDAAVVQGVKTEWGDVEFPAPAGFLEALQKVMSEIGPEEYAENEKMEIDAQEAAYRAASLAHEEAISSPPMDDRRQLSPQPQVSPLPPSGVFPTTKKPARKSDKKKDKEWRREAMLPPEDLLERELGTPSPDRGSLSGSRSRYLAPPGLQPIEDDKATREFVPNTSPRPQPGKIRRQVSNASTKSSSSSRSSVGSLFGFGKSKRRDTDASLDSRSSIFSDSSSSRRPVSIVSSTSTEGKRERRRSLFGFGGGNADRPSVESEIGDATYVSYTSGRARSKSTEYERHEEDMEELQGVKGILRKPGSFDPKRRRVHSIGLTGEIDENAKTIYSVRFANATQGLGLRSVAEDEAHRGGDQTHALKWIGVGRGRYGNMELKTDETSDEVFAEQAAQIKKKWRAFGAEQRDWARVKID